MAKQFCDQAEAARILGVSEDEVRAMARDGRLRVFNDAKGPQYRVDDLNKLISKEGSSIIDLAVSDTEPKADIGLSGSDVIALESDEPARPTKEDTKITSVGISVFDDEELEIDADPMAKTHVSAAMEDQVVIGGSGSGSGLLDLTRESDDTSLGAELLDVISPTEAQDTETAPQSPAEVSETITAPASAAGVEEDYSLDTGTPMMVTPRSVAADPMGGLFSGLLVACIVVLGFVGFVMAGALQGVWPEFMTTITQGTNLYIYVLGGGAGIAIVAALVGFLTGKSGGGKPKRAVVTR